MQGQKVQQQAAIKDSPATRRQTSIRVRRNVHTSKASVQDVSRTTKQSPNKIRSNATPKIEIYLAGNTDRNGKESSKRRVGSCDKEEKQINVTLHVKGTPEFVATVINKTRSSLTRVVAPKKDQGLIEMPEELLPSRRYARRIGEEKEFREHKIYRDSVFEEHERSASNARESSMRAQSANEKVRQVLTGANTVLETYKKAENDFKQSMQQRLNGLLSEESVNYSAAGCNQQRKRVAPTPRYMSWRPENYNVAKPRRTGISFMQAAAAAKKRENNIRQSAMKVRQPSPIKSSRDDGSQYALSMNCATTEDDTKSSQQFNCPSDSASALSYNSCQRSELTSQQSNRSNLTNFHPAPAQAMTSDNGKFLALPSLRNHPLSARNNVQSK